MGYQPEGGGRFVSVDHGDGFVSTYCHLTEQKVAVGDLVSAGQLVGLSGGGTDDPMRGASTGPHLHFGVSYKNKWTDPLKVFELCGAALKYICPFDSSRASPNLWQHFANNESAEQGIGGYYAIGLIGRAHV